MDGEVKQEAHFGLLELLHLLDGEDCHQQRSTAESLVGQGNGKADNYHHDHIGRRGGKK